MKKENCTAFLQWALPRLGLRWKGFRKVQGQVCKRLRRRLEALEVEDLAAYRAYLDRHPAEWQALDAMCRITISRFYRDWAVFDALRREHLPALAGRARAEGRPLRCWSAGCASGEEPYTLSLILHLELAPRLPGLQWTITATDADAHMLERARQACYPAGNLRYLPDGWRRRAFRRQGDAYCLLPELKASVHLQQGDIRRELPAGPFDLILCRYLAGTYFGQALQASVFQRLADRLPDDGRLVIGSHEQVPATVTDLQLIDAGKMIYRRRPGPGR